MSDCCRLCMSSELLVDLLTLDGDANLSIKVTSCIGIQIIPDDRLPTLICKHCKEIINIFFNFKQKCLEVDVKLRALVSSQCLNIHKSSVDVDSPNRHYDSKLYNHSHIINKIGSKIIENQQCHIEKIKVATGGNNEENKSKNMEQITSTINQFQCEICGRIFKIKAGLDNHLLTHSGFKPYQCKLCPKRYCRMESVTIHMRSHAGIKPYVCEICGKTSTKRQDLIRHMKIHSDERNYACPICDRQFKRPSDVTSHMRTHTGSRPYHCESCKKTYTSHSGLRKHYKSQCKSEGVAANCK